MIKDFVALGTLTLSLTFEVFAQPPPENPACVTGYPIARRAVIAYGTPAAQLGLAAPTPIQTASGNPFPAVFEIDPGLELSIDFILDHPVHPIVPQLPNPTPPNNGHSLSFSWITGCCCGLFPRKRSTGSSQLRSSHLLTAGWDSAQFIGNLEWFVISFC